MSTRKIYSYVVTVCLFVFFVAGESLACPSNPPVAILSAEPAYVDVDENTILDGNDSYDLNGSIVKYEWDFDYNDVNFEPDYNETSGSAGDGVFDGNTPHSYSTAGVYTVMLRVTDNGNLTDTDTCKVYVRGTYYVDPNGNDANDGLSWATAFATIQKGVDSAVGGNPDDPNKYDVIDVNKSTYVTGPIWVENDNLRLVFEPNVIVEAQSNIYPFDPDDANNPFRIDPNSPSNGDCLFTISEVKNIIFDGDNTIFKMKKSEYEANEVNEPYPGYSRHIIRLRGNVDNVELRGLSLKDSRGCGIILGWCGISKNVLIEDVKLFKTVSFKIIQKHPVPNTASILSPSLVTRY